MGPSIGKAVMEWFSNEASLRDPNAQCYVIAPYIRRTLKAYHSTLVDTETQGLWEERGRDALGTSVISTRANGSMTVPVKRHWRNQGNLELQIVSGKQGRAVTSGERHATNAMNVYVPKTNFATRTIVPAAMSSTVAPLLSGSLMLRRIHVPIHTDARRFPPGKSSVRQLQSLPALDVWNEKINQYEVHAGKSKAESILISPLFGAVCKCCKVGDGFVLNLRERLLNLSDRVICDFRY